MTAATATDSTDDNKDSSDPTLPGPQLMAYVKSIMPTADPADIVKGAVAAKKQFPNITDDQIIQGFMAAKQGGAVAPDAAPQAAQAPADPNNVTLPPTTITAPAQQPVTGVAPTAAAQDAMYQGNGPTANRLNAIDPAAYKAAAADLANQQGANGGLFNSVARLVGNVGAGAGGTLDSYLKRQAEQDAAARTGAVKGAADLANTGLTAANNTLNQSTATQTAQAKLAMDQKTFLQDYALKGLSVDQQQAAWDVGQKLYDPTSTASTLTQRLAEQALGLKQGNLDGHSAAQITAELKGMDPALVINKQAYDQLIAKENADSNSISAAAGANQANAAAAATNLGTKLISNATNGGTTVPVGMNLSVGAGPASLSPNAATTVPQQGGAEQTVALRNGMQHWDQAGVGTATDTALNTLKIATLKDTGKPGAWLSQIPATQAQSIRAALIGQQQAANPGMTADQAASNADTLMKSGTAVQLRQQLALGKATQAAKKSVLVPAQEAYLQQHGNLIGFQEPAMAKYWDPQTGKVAIGTTPADIATLEKSGYRPLTGAQ